jgi:hypothetical protein
MHETGSEQESCANCTPAMQSVQGWFQTAQRSMVLPYLIVRVFKNWWFLMRWKQGLKEFLKIKFSSIVHLWTCAQISMETTTSLSSLVDD